MYTKTVLRQEARKYCDKIIELGCIKSYAHYQFWKHYYFNENDRTNKTLRSHWCLSDIMEQWWSLKLIIYNELEEPLLIEQ